MKCSRNRQLSKLSRGQTDGSANSNGCIYSGHASVRIGRISQKRRENVRLDRRIIIAGIDVAGHGAHNHVLVHYVTFCVRVLPMGRKMAQPFAM